MPGPENRWTNAARPSSGEGHHPQRALEAACAEHLVRTVREPLVVLDAALRVVSANGSFYKTFALDPEATEGRLIYEAGNGQWDIPRLRTVLEETLPAQGACDDVEVVHAFERIGRRTMRLNARRFDTLPFILLAIEDVTDCKETEAALHESEERFRNLFQASPDAIFVESLDGRVLDVNPAACRLHHAPRATLIGMNVRDLVPPDQRPAAMRDFEQLVNGEVKALQAYSWTVNQHAVPVEIRANRVLYDGREAVLLIVRDISERIEAREALEESRARAQAILDTTVDAIVTINEQGLIETVNPATERIFGYTAEELIGRNVSRLMPAPYREEHDQHIRRYLETGQRHIIGIGREVVARRKDGTTFPVDLAVSEVHVGDRRIFTGFIRDISERRRLEHEVLRISDEERQRIGRDLHDGLGSLLTGVAMGAQGLAQARKRGLPVEADALEHLAQMVEEGAAQAQALSRGLNPVKLDKEGLPAALKELAANTLTLTRTACIFNADAALPALSSVVATQLYWIAREALNNAVKHADAAHIEVRLAVEKDDLVLAVRDDGTGLPDDPTSRTGTGLHIMPYRANLIGATYSIQSTTAGGTVVACRLPLEKAVRPHPA